MITWKTHDSIYIARNPLNGVYSFDILNHNEKNVRRTSTAQRRRTKATNPTTQHRYSRIKALSNLLDGWLLRCYQHKKKPG